MRLKHQTFYKKIHFERVLSQARHSQKTQLQKLSQRSQRKFTLKGSSHRLGIHKKRNYKN
jgi:hypothetical protein